MTGLYGIWAWNGDDPAVEFAAMGRALARFGGDSHRQWDGGSVRLGRHGRDLFPEDRHDVSPDRGRRYVVAGDLRLTERPDLAQALGIAPELAVRLSDTALAAEAIEQWHEAAFDRLYGDFAVAAWDCAEHRLLLARDPLGHKPLFLHRRNGGVAFASMPDGLKALDGVGRQADPIEMKRFLCLLSPSRGRTHFVGIDRVDPGHYVEVTREGFRSARWWKPDLTPLLLPAHRDYVDALRDRFDAAVAACLRGAEETVGAQLSSGFDSSAVATTAALALAPLGGTVIAFTAVPRPGHADAPTAWRRGDEGGVAAQTAAMHPNMQHVLVRPEGGLLANLDRTASAYGMPQLNLCNMQWADDINDAARARGVRVMLEGSMGNATISESGVLALHELLRAGRFQTWFGIARGLVRGGWMRWRGILWNSLSPWAPLALWRYLEEKTGRAPLAVSRYSPLRRDHWRDLSEQTAADHRLAHPLDREWHQEWERPSSSSMAERLAMLVEDFGSYYKAMLATWGIDARDPTADRRLVEFSLRIPTEHLIHKGRPRAMLRDILAGRAPAAVLDGQKKGYQAADWHVSLNDAKAQAAEEVARIEMFDPSAELIDIPRLKAMLAAWPDDSSDDWHSEEAKAGYRHALLRGISAASFMRKAAGSNY